MTKNRKIIIGIIIAAAIISIPLSIETSHAATTKPKLIDHTTHTDKTDKYIWNSYLYTETTKNTKCQVIKIQLKRYYKYDTTWQYSNTKISYIKWYGRLPYTGKYSLVNHHEKASNGLLEISRGMTKYTNILKYYMGYYRPSLMEYGFGTSPDGCYDYAS